MSNTKTAEVVNALIDNFDYDKFVNENKEEMNKPYRVTFGNTWLMGDTKMTNKMFIQKRATWFRKDNDPMWKGDIIRLIVRIMTGNKPNDMDLTEEKRQTLAIKGFNN